MSPSVFMIPRSRFESIYETNDVRPHPSPIATCLNKNGTVSILNRAVRKDRQGQTQGVRVDRMRVSGNHPASQRGAAGAPEMKTYSPRLTIAPKEVRTKCEILQVQVYESCPTFSLIGPNQNGGGYLGDFRCSCRNRRSRKCLFLPFFPLTMTVLTS